MDADSSGALDWEEFVNVMAVVKMDFSDDDLAKIFNYVDLDNNGTIDLLELEKFLGMNACPRDLIRYSMLINLHKPERFLKYHIFKATSRPLPFSIRPGPSRSGAYFAGSVILWMRRNIKLGSPLTYINSFRVDRKKFIDIERMLRR